MPLNLKPYNMTATNRSVLREIATAIPSIFIIESGIAKITGAAPYIEQASAPSLVLWLGCIEAILGILFMFGKTLRVALLGLNCYFIAAIAAGAAHHSVPFFPLIMLIAVWISVGLRDGAVFISIVKRNRVVLGITIRKKN